MSTLRKITGVITVSILSSFLMMGFAQEKEQSQQKNDQQLKKTPAAQTDVSDEELKKFASALGEIQKAQRKTQKKMQKVLKEEEISARKYRKIYKAKNDPQKDPQASEADIKKYKKAEKRLKKVQKKNKKNVDKAIKESGLTPQRYKEIYKTVRKDQELQQKVKKMRQDQSSGSK